MLFYFKITSVFTDMYLSKKFEILSYFFSKLFFKMTAESRSSNSADVGLFYSKAH